MYLISAYFDEKTNTVLEKYIDEVARATGQLLPYVFYVTPVLNEYLTELSNKVYCAFKDLPDAEISKYYRPGNWLPHVTIGKKLSEEQMKQAFEVMYKRFQPLEAEIVEIGLSKVNPHEDGLIDNV